MSYDDPRRAYLDVGLRTASPEKLLLLLWDRLLLDLEVAEAAIEARDPATAGQRLLHAQEIVFELRATLRHDAWEGAPALSSLYAFVEEQLVQANVRKDAALVATCRELLEPLRQAFHEAARISGAQRAALAATA